MHMGMPAGDILSLSVLSFVSFCVSFFSLSVSPFSFSFFLSSLLLFPHFFNSLFSKLPFMQVFNLAPHSFKRVQTSQKAFRGNCVGIVKEVEREENDFGCKTENLGEARLIRGLLPFASTHQAGTTGSGLCWRGQMDFWILYSAHLIISYSLSAPIWVSTTLSP